MSGLWVFVCGPSGAGKDSVMNWAADHLTEHTHIVFARRMVTRDTHPGSDHDPVTPEQFARLSDSGGLVWRWQAHGFHYGIAAHYAAQVAAGQVVVVNGSREHAGGLEPADHLRVVHISAQADLLAQRLEKRGRDTPQARERRLVRNHQFSDLRGDHTIINQGELGDAGRQLADYLLASA
jgi:ribose 1,5-bisphosphokinase